MNKKPGPENIFLVRITVITPILYSEKNVSSDLSIFAWFFSDEEDLEEADVDVEDSDSILNSAIRAQREMDAVRARKTTFTDTGEVKMIELEIPTLYNTLDSWTLCL